VRHSVERSTRLISARRNRAERMGLHSEEGEPRSLGVWRRRAFGSEAAIRPTDNSMSTRVDMAASNDLLFSLRHQGNDSANASGEPE